MTEASIALRLPSLSGAVMAAAMAVTFAWPGLAGAEDRPYLAVTSAAAEEDDERVWSIETLATNDKTLNHLGVVAEYSFDPLHAVQFELGRSRDRLGETTSVEASVEVKWLFNRIARDGWGIGVVGSLSTERESGTGAAAGGWSLVMPLSIRLGQDVALLHLNAGLMREGGERRRLLAAGIEGELWRRVTGFAEIAAQGEARLAHGGVRWWLRRERVALDISAYRRREDGSTFSGWVIGLGWYDL